MKKTRVKNLFLIIGITIFLFGSLMRISHINYGIETLFVGILILGFGLILPVLTNRVDNLTTDFPLSNYPNILQSFGITGIVILGMLLLIPVNLTLNNMIGKEASMLLYYLLAIGIPFGIVYSIRKGKTKINSFNVTLGNKRIIPVIAICSIALLFGIASPIGSLIPMPESIKKAFMAFGSQTGIFAFILMVIAAPILEELIFRGIILDGLLRIYSPIKSILVSSFLFGLVHLNPWQFVTGLIVGIFSGWVYYKTRSLLPSIIIHAAANLSGFGMRLILDIDSSMDKSLVESYGGLTYLILTILGSIVIVSTCIYYLNKVFIKT
jgi:membrane protease YdiL (CAAX protease family)